MLEEHGPCEGKISGEHYISHALLKQLGPSKAVHISGTPWSGSTPIKVGKSALTANILCQKHNASLSNLDSLASRLLKALQTAQLQLKQGTKTSPTHTFIGPNFERWLLKVGYMMWASGNLANQSSRIPSLPPKNWNGILTGKDDFPDFWGLYVEPPERPFVTAADEFEVVPLSASDGSGIKAIRFQLARIPFTLVMGKPDQPGSFGMRRPRAVVLQNEFARHTLRLTWPAGNTSEPIIYTRLGDAAE